MVNYCGEEFFSNALNPQTDKSLLVGCPRLLFQYICSYPPWLGCKHLIIDDYLEKQPTLDYYVTMHKLTLYINQLKLIISQTHFFF